MGSNPVRSLVAIDPGASTGIACFDSCGNLVRAFTVKDKDVLERFLFLHPTAVCVCEQGPENRKQADLVARVEAVVREKMTLLHWVRPTEWKPSPHAKLLATDKPDTQHAKDAIRMGRWFIHNRPEYFVASA